MNARFADGGVALGYTRYDVVGLDGATEDAAGGDPAVGGQMQRDRGSV